MTTPSKAAIERANELIALAERCEAATGPNYALDCEISEAVWLSKWGKKKPKDIRAPNYTASVDAAMRLIDPEAYWQVGHDGDGRDPSMFAARIFDPLTMRTPVSAVAETPALALTAAGLKIVKEGE